MFFILEARIAQWYNVGLRARWRGVRSCPDRGWELFSSPPRPDRLWGPPSLLSNVYQGREADHLHL